MSADALMALDAVTGWYGFVPTDPAVWLLVVLVVVATIVWSK
jgi:hypothetical protein